MRVRSLLLTILLGAACSFAQDSQSTPTPDSPPTSSDSQPQHRRPGVAGTITAINADSFTVKTMGGSTAEVKLTSNTQFRKDRQPAQLADFKVGDQIMVRGQSSGANVWQAEMVAAGSPGAFAGRMREDLGKKYIVGEIKAIDGMHLTIQRPDGVSQTIAVDETTSFKKDGESITLADFKAGDHVFGRGDMKNDVFVPSTLNWGEFRMGGRGQGQHRGQGEGVGAGQGQETTPPQQ